MTSDYELLRRYAVSRSEDAFAELVCYHPRSSPCCSNSNGFTAPNGRWQRF